MTVENGENTYASQEKHEFEKTGLTVSVTSPAIEAAQQVAASVERGTEVKDDRLKALYAYKAREDALENKDNLKQLGHLSKGKLELNVSLGKTKSESQSDSLTKTAKESTVAAGGDVSIKATEGDLEIKGSEVSGTNVTLDAKKNLNIEAAENSNKTNSSSSESSASVGAGFGIHGLSSISISGNKQNGEIKENSTTYQESNVTAAEKLSMHSGEDTNIIGSKASGEKVDVKVEGNLNLQSLQDKETYDEKNSSSGFGISANIAHPAAGTSGNNTVGTPNYNGSVSKGNINSDYNSVTKQAEIHAGQGGFDIEVGKNTDLKGAVISSDATPDKNKLSTDSLTYSDVQNKADYSANEKGFSAQGGAKKSVMPTVSMPISGDAGSTTKAAIANGSIEIRSNPKQDISQLNRDTGNSLNRLGKIFDKESIKEKQELTNLFGQEAYKAIGDVDLKEYVKAKEAAAKYKEGSPEYKQAMERASAWDEGGSNKIWLHALAGGIMSSLSGNGFVAGASGAGLNEALQKELAKIKDPGLHELGSMVIGAAAAKLIRENAKTGMVTALNGTKYNWLDHEDQLAILQSESVINTPVTRTLESADGIRYVREINLDKTIGIDKFSGQPTSTMTVLTDKFGNLVTATPGVIK